jgi:hypothetical protein
MQSPVDPVQRVTSEATLNDLHGALETAQQSPLDLCGNAINADVAAPPADSPLYMSTAQLLWQVPAPGQDADEWIALCGWKDRGSSVACWTLFKNAWTVCNGVVHLPPESQLWLFGSGLCFENVKFSGVCASLTGTGRDAESIKAHLVLVCCCVRRTAVLLDLDGFGQSSARNAPEAFPTNYSPTCRASTLARLWYDSLHPRLASEVVTGVWSL